MHPLVEEINQLARDLGPYTQEEIVQAAADLAGEYSAATQQARTLHAVEQLLGHDIVDVENRYDLRIQEERERLRDGLKALLNKAKGV